MRLAANLQTTCKLGLLLYSTAITIFSFCLSAHVQYGDSIDNTVENSSVFSLIRMCWLHAGSKTLHQLNPPVLNWRCWLTEVDLYNGCKWVVVVVVLLSGEFTDLPNVTILDAWKRCLTKRMSFLLPNQQSHSTEWKTTDQLGYLDIYYGLFLISVL